MTRLPPRFVLRDSYESLLGPDAWARLNPAIRARFSAGAAHRPVTYEGVMQRVEMSTAGRFLAQCCRLIGTPLALHAGVDVPTTVKVYPDDSLGGMAWDRSYRYAGRPTCRVRSTKRIDAAEGLLELIGFGFGMRLAVSEEAGALHFSSTRFFLAIAGRRITIPLLLTPGVTRVSQTDLGDGEFRFELDVRHPLLGRTYYQVGTFRAVERPPPAS
ncbi:MAG: DUF4166 domain-containing protein [Gammaproteobacteria bacterium]